MKVKRFLVQSNLSSMWVAKNTILPAALLHDLAPLYILGPFWQCSYVPSSVNNGFSPPTTSLWGTLKEHEIEITWDNNENHAVGILCTLIHFFRLPSTATPSFHCVANGQINFTPRLCNTGITSTDNDHYPSWTTISPEQNTNIPLHHFYSEKKICCLKGVP